MVTRIKYKPKKTSRSYDGADLTVTPLGGRVYHYSLTTQHGAVVEMVWEAKSFRRAWVVGYQLSVAFRVGGYRELNRWIKTKMIEYD